MNHYEILGIGPNGTEQQIKEAYRREAMKWHPDRHESSAAKGEADRRFKDLALAYRTLRNPDARADYDRQLEQKLHQEYNARHQEHAKQQRAQDEQVKQQQTHQEPPRSNFDTGSQFEEETVSGDDAKQMFFEQMLDLAFELAGRGFPEDNIFKALIALGCPETMAYQVAKIAAKLQSEKKETSASSKQATNMPKHESKTTSGSKRDQNGFNTTSSMSHAGLQKNEFIVKPKRYLTIIGALLGLWIIFESISAWSNPSGGQGWTGGGAFGLPNEMYQIFFRYIGITFGAFCLIHWGQVSIANVLMIIDNDGIRFSRGGGRVTKWEEIDDFFLDKSYLKISGHKLGKKWQDSTHKMFISGDCQEILSRIDEFKNDSTNQTGSSTPRIATIKNVPIILVVGISVLAISGILAAIALPAYQDYKRRVQVATGFALGSMAAQKVGDFYIQKNKGPTDLESSGFSLTPSKTVKNIVYDSVDGVITISYHDLFFGSKFLLLIPVVTDGKVTWLCTGDGIDVRYLPESCKENQTVANTHLATLTKKRQARDKVQSDYEKTLASLEKDHPELNPDSPYFNSAALSWVAERKKFYDQAGDKSPIITLQQAVIDYSNALQQNKN